MSVARLIPPDPHVGCDTGTGQVVINKGRGGIAVNGQRAIFIAQIQSPLFTTNWYHQNNSGKDFNRHRIERIDDKFDSSGSDRLTKQHAARHGPPLRPTCTASLLDPIPLRRDRYSLPTYFRPYDTPTSLDTGLTTP